MPILTVYQNAGICQCWPTLLNERAEARVWRFGLVANPQPHQQPLLPGSRPAQPAHARVFPAKCRGLLWAGSVHADSETAQQPAREVTLHRVVGLTGFGQEKLPNEATVRTTWHPPRPAVP